MRPWTMLQLSDQIAESMVLGFSSDVARLQCMQYVFGTLSMLICIWYWLSTQEQPFLSCIAVMAKTCRLMQSLVFSAPNIN